MLVRSKEEQGKEQEQRSRKPGLTVETCLESDGGEEGGDDMGRKREIEGQRRRGRGGKNTPVESGNEKRIRAGKRGSRG